MRPFEYLTERLHLRPVEAGDAEATAKLVTEEVSAGLLTWPPRMTPAGAMLRIEKAATQREEGRGIDLAILRREDGQLLGWLGLAVVDGTPRRARLAYWIGADFWNSGFVTEAASAAVPELAQRLGVQILEADAQPHNLASKKVLERLGFRRVGSKRNYSPVRERTEDVDWYEMQV